MRVDKVNAKIRKAFEEKSKSNAAYCQLCLETFTPGTMVTWLVNRANGKYRQFGTVTDTHSLGTIWVQNSRTGNIIRMDVDAIVSYRFEKLTKESTHAK